MNEKTKDIAIVSLEEWGQFIDQLLEEHIDMMANIFLSVKDADPKMVEMCNNLAALVFGQVSGAISKKLFPDAKLTQNEKGELKWK